MALIRLSHVSEAVRRFLPLLLTACYLVAFLVPWPGQSLHAWSLPDELPNVLRPRVSHLLVALLLFLAALGVEVHRLAAVVRQPGLLLAALAMAWLAPAAVVLVAWWLLPLVVHEAAALTLILGFALVAAMPVANSAAAWTQQSRGELPWALALVVLSIIVCPWMIPLVLQLLGLSFSADQRDALEQLTSSFTGVEFVVWVLLPTGCGILVRRLVGPERVVYHRQGVLLWSASALLMLNYVNASVALPRMQSELTLGWLTVCVATAVVLCLAGYAAAQLLGRWFVASSGTVLALGYSLSMKNTGLALALASDVLAEQPLLLLPVFIMTLTQHLFASALHRTAVHRLPLVDGDDSQRAHP